MVEHYCLDVEICSESGRVTLQPVGEGAEDRVGRLHRPPLQLRVGETVQLRLVGHQLGPGRVDLVCRIVALYHDDIWRKCEAGASFRVAVIEATQRGVRRSPAEVFGDLEEGLIPQFDGVVGNLAMMSVADLLQNLEANGQTALLELQAEGGVRGAVWTQGGRLRHAELGALEGAEAFFALINIESGMFRLRYNVPTAFDSVQARVSQLLLEGMRRFDESARAPDPLEETDPSLTFDLSISDEGPPLPC